MNFSESMCSLAADIANLAKVTGGFGWDRGEDALFANPSDLGAKPIPKNEWLEAMRVAIDLTRAAPHAGKPTPGADPEGFVWLTWEKSGTRFALGITKGGYKWERRDGLGIRSEVSPTIADAAAAMRAAFTKPAS